MILEKHRRGDLAGQLQLCRKASVAKQEIAFKLPFFCGIVGIIDGILGDRSMSMRIHVILTFLFVWLSAPMGHAADWYVSQSTGKGKKATKEAPSKDLGNIITKLQAGDVVHIAEGVYLGRGKMAQTPLMYPSALSVVMMLPFPNETRGAHTAPFFQGTTSVPTTRPTPVCI